MRTTRSGQIGRIERAMAELQTVVDRMAELDDEQARVETLLMQFTTVVRRGQIRPVDQSQA